MQCLCTNETDKHEDKENEIDLDESRECQLDLQTTTEQPITINQLLRWKHYKQPAPGELLKVRITFFF